MAAIDRSCRCAGVESQRDGRWPDVQPAANHIIPEMSCSVASSASVCSPCSSSLTTSNCVLTAHRMTLHPQLRRDALGGTQHHHRCRRADWLRRCISESDSRCCAAYSGGDRSRLANRVSTRVPSSFILLAKTSSVQRWPSSRGSRIVGGCAGGQARNRSRPWPERTLPRCRGGSPTMPASGLMPAANALAQQQVAALAAELIRGAEPVRLSLGLRRRPI